MGAPQTEDREQEAGRSAWRHMLPVQLGLALAALSLGVLAPVSDMSPDDASMASTLLAAAGIAVLLVMTLRTGRFSKRFIWVSTFISIHVAGLASLVLGLYGIIQHQLPGVLEIPLRAVAVICSALLSFYWLRKLRGTAASAVAATVYGAIAIAGIAFFIIGVARIASPLIVFIASFIQFGLIKVSRTLPSPSDAFPATAEAYFGTTEHRFSSRGYLAAAALGICCFAVTVGMAIVLPGAPVGGNAIMSRAFATVVVAIATFMVVRVSAAVDGHAPTTGVWTIMQLMLALSALATASSTTMGRLLGVGLSVAAAYMLQAFVWYVVVAFLSFGLRDPYFYAATGWLSSTVLGVLGTALAQRSLPVAPEAPAFSIALLYTLTLISNQVVFTRLLRDPESARMGRGGGADEADASSSEDGAEAGRADTIMDAMGVPPEAMPGSAGSPDVHIATSVIAMGQRFGLTGREIEVLTLYALGHTQARVSEELSLSTNTVHTHIKRIYDKTDLHSRQEILDYIAEYGG